MKCRDSVPVFRVPVKKYTEATTVVSIRIPKDMLVALDGLADETGRTRNELVTLALEFALDHLEITQDQP